MRDPRELLALLTTRVQRFAVAPGGIPAITADDIAHALGMIQHDTARLYARVKYAGEVRYAEGVAGAIRSQLIRSRMIDCDLGKIWRVPRPDFLIDMGYLLLAEAVDPHTCSWCDGRAEVRPETGPVIVCGACKGTGRRPMKDFDRARLMGLAKSSWSETWSQRYRDAQVETVDRWDDMIAGAIKKRMSP